MIKKNYQYVALIFIIGTVLTSLYSNKYIVLTVPPLTTIVILYLLKNEWLSYDWNLLKNRTLYVWTYYGVSACIFIQALGTLLFGHKSTPAEISSFQFVILPLYFISGAIIEEIFFRKIILSWLTKYIPFWCSALISSSLYSLCHFNVTRLLTYIAVGYILCLIYKKSNSILTTILIHIILNIIGLLAITIRGY